MLGIGGLFRFKNSQILHRKIERTARFPDRLKSKMQQASFDIRTFKLERIINFNHTAKVISLLGKFGDDEEDKKAVVVLYKNSFDTTSTNYDQIFQNMKTAECVHGNDVFFKFILSSDDENLNSITSQIIYPADQKIIDKYSMSESRLIVETPELYEKVTGVYAKDTPKSKNNWIYNVLDHDAESQKTIFKDKDPETGFTLCLDLATGSEIKENFHVLALVERRDLSNLRDLNASHLPLLRNMQTVGTQKVSEYFGVPKDQIRAYFHYQPKHGVLTERAKLLTSVINNIELVPDYYQRATIEFPLRETDHFYKYIQENLHKVQS